MEPIDENDYEEEYIVQDEGDYLIEDDYNMYDLENYIISDMPCVTFVMPAK